jgi:hypothetical protein
MSPFAGSAIIASIEPGPAVLRDFEHTGDVKCERLLGQTPCLVEVTLALLQPGKSGKSTPKSLSASFPIRPSLLVIGAPISLRAAWRSMLFRVCRNGRRRACLSREEL